LGPHTRGKIFWNHHSTKLWRKFQKSFPKIILKISPNCERAQRGPKIGWRQGDFKENSISYTKLGNSLFF
jgi:hypothetical protein